MSKKIMVCDDAPIIRLMITDFLQFNGYEIVAEAVNGKDAVEKYKQFTPDLVTMDVIMPEMDGIQALEEILKINQNAKVVMVTAIDQRESLIKAIRIGATDYIVKPFENDRVVSAVKTALGD